MNNKYWESIPVWKADGKCFEVMADHLSGRIPVTRLERWQDFSELLESDFFNANGIQFIFRGHRRYDWSLLPTLGRLTENGIVSEELADKQLDLFRRAVRGRLKDTSILVEAEQEDELWSVGQHHGLMTPLLDWTYSPYVALFFAFAKEDQQGEEDNPYRAVYVLNKSFVADDDQCPDIRLLEPRKDDHGRLVEPGRIQLIAKQLRKEFEKHKVVDWESRDAIQAKLRNVARVILRKYGYPVTARDQVVDKILDNIPEAKQDDSVAEKEG